MRVPKYLRRKKSHKDRRGRHTKADRIARKKLFVPPEPQKCRGCNNVLDPTVCTDEGDALVCTNCALVDDTPCFDLEVPVISNESRRTLYRHKNYFSERILQARDKEPRFTETELDIFSSVYDIFRLQCPTLWSESYFTKKHAARICRLIVKQCPNSAFKRRLERWFQYRNYICGNVGVQLPLDVANALKTLFDAYSRYFTIYVETNGLCRKNITQLDLVILILLYNLHPKLVNDHGWYFLNGNILNKTTSTRLDMIRIKSVCRLVNARILINKPDNSIQPECYAWFRTGKKLKVPTLTTLINRCLNNPMGYYQYIAYKNIKITPMLHMKLRNEACMISASPKKIKKNKSLCL
jgi:hypothetical protein